MLKRLIFILVWMWGAKLYGVDFDVLNQVRHQMILNPDRLVLDAYHYIQSSEGQNDSTSSRRGYIHAAFALGHLRHLSKEFSSEDVKAILKSALQKSKVLNEQVMSYYLTLLLIDMGEGNLKLAKGKDRKEQLRYLMVNSQSINPVLYVSIAIYYIEHLKNLGLDEEALEKMIDVYDLVRRDSSFHKLDRIAIYQSLAVMFDSERQYEKGLFCYLEIQRLAESLGAQNLILRNITEMALHYLDREPPVVTKATQLLKDAEKMAIVMGDEWAKSKILLSQAKSYFLAGDFKNSEEASAKAVAAFSQFADEVWLADAHQWLAQAQEGNGKLTEALKNVQEAKQRYPKDFTFDHAMIAQREASILKKMGDYPRAIESLEEYITYYEAYTNSLSSKSYGQEKARLGLQFAEERNQILALENQMQRETRFFKEASICVDCSRSVGCTGLRLDNTSLSSHALGLQS